MRSREIELPRAADSGNCGCNCRGIDAGRLVTRESEQNCAVRRVADASESQRSVELGLDARHMIEQASAAKLTRIGPMVCELDGPTPILYRSNRLVVTDEIVQRMRCCWSAIGGLLSPPCGIH